MECVGKAKAGRLLDGVEHNEFPKMAVWPCLWMDYGQSEMSRARTYTKSEIADAAAAAAMHNVRVVLHPSGEIEFLPRNFVAKQEEDTAEQALEGWRNGRKIGRRS